MRTLLAAVALFSITVSAWAFPELAPPNVVPEPDTLALLAIAGAALAYARRRKK